MNRSSVLSDDCSSLMLLLLPSSSSMPLNGCCSLLRFSEQKRSKMHFQNHQPGRNSLYKSTTTRPSFLEKAFVLDNIVVFLGLFLLFWLSPFLFAANLNEIRVQYQAFIMPTFGMFHYFLLYTLLLYLWYIFSYIPLAFEHRDMHFRYFCNTSLVMNLHYCPIYVIHIRHGFCVIWVSKPHKTYLVFCTILQYT